MRARTKTNQGFTLIELMIVIAIVAILAAILVPNLIRARSRAQLTGCTTNLKTIATALEMYNVDHTGRYPQDFGTLTPNYIKTVPACPATGTDTYSPSYLVGINPDTFDLFCSGSNHGGFAPPDYPQFNSVQGLIER